MLPPFLDLHAHFPMHTKFPPNFSSGPPPAGKELEYWAANQLLNYQKGSPRVSLPNLLTGADGGIGSVLYDPEDEFFHDAAPVPSAIGDLLAQMDNVEKAVAGQVSLVKNPDDLQRCIDSRQKFLFHCVEGAFCVSGNENNVDALAARGVAYVIVAHLFFRGLATCDNAFPFLPDPVFSLLNPQQDPATGLTPLGVRVVDRLLDRGIVVDITHSTDLAQAQIFKMARDHSNAPVISSHNGVRALSNYPLNLSREAIQQIAASNGVVGIILFPYWLRQPEQQLTGLHDISLVFQAIDYIREVTGSYRNVAIGTDLDGFIEPITDCQDWAQTPSLVRLIQATYPADYERILCWNAVETLQRGWKGATHRPLLVRHTVAELLRMTNAQLDQLFGSVEPGPIPNGPADGTAIIAPGTDLNPAIAKFAGLIWQGKIFDAKNGTLINEIFGQKAVEAKVYFGPSLYDGKPCIVLDYSHSSAIVEHVRDEIRQIDPNFYLGRVYWDGSPLIHFCLQFKDRIP